MAKLVTAFQVRPERDPERNKDALKALAEVYWEDLGDYPIGTIEQGFRWARRNLQWFPKIAELREILQEFKEADLPSPALTPEVEPIMDREESARRLKEIIEMLGGEWGMLAEPCLEGELVEEFEENRRRAKKAAKQLMN